MQFELKRLTMIMWRWSWLLFLATMLASAGSYWASRQSAKIYRTTTTLLVGQYLKDSDPRTVDFSTSVQLAQGYAQMVQREPILKATGEAIGLGTRWESLASRVNAAVIPGSSLIQISAVSTDPQSAKLIADEIARQLILQTPAAQDKDFEKRQQFASEQLETIPPRIKGAQKQIQDLQEQLAIETSALRVGDLESQIRILEDRISNWQSIYTNMLSVYTGSRVNYISVLEPARLPFAPADQNTRLNVLLAAIIGFLLAATAILVMEYFDETLRTMEDVRKILAISPSGIFAKTVKPGNMADTLIDYNDYYSPLSEEFRLLRTNLQFAWVKNAPMTLLITSSGPRETSAVMAANLAVSFAQSGRRTILVDADLRKPSLSIIFGMHDEVGLASMLLGEPPATGDQLLLKRISPTQTVVGQEETELRRRFEAYLAPTELTSLKLLLSGSALANPADLFASPRFDQALKTLQGLADVVIFNSPPVHGAADALILASKVSGVLLAVELGQTRSPLLSSAVESLNHAKANILGFYITQSKRRVWPNLFPWKGSKTSRELHALPHLQIKALERSTTTSVEYLKVKE